MHNFKYFLFLIIWIGCGDKPEPEPNTPPQPTLVTYTESMEDFPNPERGFYRYSETRASNYSTLSEAQLKGYRTPKKPSSGNYEVISTLVFRYYVLDEFRQSPISESYLNNVRADFTTAKNAGVKLIPRFTYTTQANGGDCDESFICPPYGDASKEIVLQHIQQLKPLFEEGAAVIACVQMGFIGTWGENYYTDFFGDASSNGQGKVLDENWADRIDVLNALLDAVPDELMVQVRYPQLKQRAVYGINALVTSAALTEAEAFTATDKARIGFHNDCFLASSNDFGTYEDYGNSSSPRTSATNALKTYFANDSKYVVVGGETCNDGYSPQNDCAPVGNADEDMRTLHYSYLNADYNNQVNNDWTDGGCMESIKRNLGYRFVLREATFHHAADSNRLSIDISIDNVGYAAPYNYRPVQLVLGDTINNVYHTFDIDTDIRTWYSGSISLEESFDVTDVSAGKYVLFLSAPDQHESLKERMEYAIRFANEDVWYEPKGLNNLQHAVEIGE